MTDGDAMLVDGDAVAEDGDAMKEDESVVTDSDVVKEIEDVVADIDAMAMDAGLRDGNEMTGANAAMVVNTPKVAGIATCWVPIITLSRE